MGKWEEEKERRRMLVCAVCAESAESVCRERERGEIIPEKV